MAQLEARRAQFVQEDAAREAALAAAVAAVREAGSERRLDETVAAALLALDDLAAGYRWVVGLGVVLKVVLGHGSTVIYAWSKLVCDRATFKAAFLKAHTGSNGCRHRADMHVVHKAHHVTTWPT